MGIYHATYTRKIGQENVPFPLGLKKDGAVMPVQVAVPSALAQYLTKRKLVVPQPVKGMALVDCGSSTSCVDSQAIKQLQVSAVGVGVLLSAGGRSEENLYPARFNFPELKMFFEFSSVMSVRLKGQVVVGRDLIALIGRDVLSRCLFVYNGVHGNWTLAI